MLRQLFILGLFFVSLHCFPQFNKIYTSKLDYSWFNCDSEKNIYAIRGSNFLKFSGPGFSPKIFDFQKEGLPGFIDVSNPNELVLFFQNSNKVILLDSSLNISCRPFYLEELGLYDISMIIASLDGGLWFYNSVENTLTKLNKDFLPVVRSLSLNSYFQSPNSPNFISVHGDKIYLNVPSNGILVLGPNGEYNTAIHILGLMDFQVDGKIIYYYRDNLINCFNIKTLKTKKIFIPVETGTNNAYFFANQIITQIKDGFSIYSHDINPSENY